MINTERSISHISDVEHTYVDTNGGLGGPALGAGFGGLIGSKLNILQVL